MKLQPGQHFRIALKIAAGLCAVGAFLFVTALLIVRTAWFNDKVRDSTIAAIEHSTGGRVELGSFDFDWRKLTAKFGQLTLHGTEPANGRPLFRADSILLSLRIVSLLERNIDISSVIVNRSEAYLLVRPDGSTNIPGPRQRAGKIEEITRELLNLKIGHFEFRHTSLRTDLKQVSLSATGEGLRISLGYKGRPPRYDVALSSKQLAIDSPQLSAFSGMMEARAELRRDEIRFDQIRLESGQSTVYFAGAVRRLADPVADLRISSLLRAEDLAQRLNFPNLRSGQFQMNGNVHYDHSAPAIFKGSVDGKNIACALPGFDVHSANLRFHVEGGKDKLGFSHIHIADSGTSVDGAAALTNLNAFAFDGTVSRLDMSNAVRVFRVGDLPYSGTLSGPLRIAGKLRKGLRDVEVQTTLQMSPGTGAIPVSGQVSVSYSQQPQAFEFGDSQLDSANSHISVAGSPGKTLRLKVSSTNESELRPAFEALGLRMLSKLDLSQASGSFDGQVIGALRNPHISGALALARFKTDGRLWDELHSQIVASEGNIAFTSLSASKGSLQLLANGSLALSDWTVRDDSSMRLQASFKNAELAELNLSPAVRGTASGSMTLEGTIAAPRGRGQFTATNLSGYGERLDQVSFDASINSDTLTVANGHMHAGNSVVSFSGTYAHQRGDWANGETQLRVDSNGFPLASLSSAKKFLPALDARSEIHANVRARLKAGRLEPERADGTLTFKRVTLDGAPFGDLTVSAATHEAQLSVGVAGNLEGSPVSGNLRARLVDLDSAAGELHFGRISLSTIYDLVGADTESLSLPDGFIQGGVALDGPLLSPSQMKLQLRIDDLQVDAPASHDAPAGTVSNELAIHNIGPVLVDGQDGMATIRSLQLGARDTHLTVAGTLGYGEHRNLDLRIEGSSDFRVFQIFDPNIQSGGLSVLKVGVGGSLEHPSVDGTMELRDGSLLVKNVTNGLSHVNGLIRFNRDRATIQTLTAQSGGGELRLTGFVSFGSRGPMIYNIQASATNVRVRYTGASVSADGLLQLTGSSENGLLSGRVVVSRIFVNQNSDLGNILAWTVAAAPPPENEKDLISGLLLDVRVQNAPNLRVSTELSQDVEADIDLRVRGTAVHPTLLGTISANQGEIKVFGAKYTINRGDITFLNAVKIEPVLDLDLQTETRGITVDITVSGTLNKLNMNYRSDPPLQPKDIIALLTVGQAPSATANPSNIKANSDVSALQAGANTVLGQAISPASNRLSKLFGITNIKIDPLVQGITNTPQARLTLEQQISRDITVTYVTNLAQTSEQIFRFEWALNRQFSLVAVRDDNGEFGIDFQYKKRFR